LEVWEVAAKDGEVLSKKQDTISGPLEGPVLCKRGFAYAMALESYWICRMPLAGMSTFTNVHTCVCQVSMPIDMILDTLVGVCAKTAAM